MYNLDSLPACISKHAGVHVTGTGADERGALGPGASPLHLQQSMTMREGELERERGGGGREREIFLHSINSLDKRVSGKGVWCIPVTRHPVVLRLRTTV